MASIFLLICFYFFPYIIFSATYATRQVLESSNLRDVQEFACSHPNQILRKRELSDAFEDDAALKSVQAVDGSVSHSKLEIEGLSTQEQLPVPRKGQDTEESQAGPQIPKTILKTGQSKNGSQKTQKSVRFLISGKEFLPGSDSPHAERSREEDRVIKRPQEPTTILKSGDSENGSLSIREVDGSYNDLDETGSKKTQKSAELIFSGKELFPCSDSPRAQGPKRENCVVKQIRSRVKSSNSKSSRDSGLRGSALPEKQPLAHVEKKSLGDQQKFLPSNKQIIASQPKKEEVSNQSEVYSGIFNENSRVAKLSSEDMNTEHEEEIIKYHAGIGQVIDEGRDPNPKSIGELKGNALKLHEKKC